MSRSLALAATAFLVLKRKDLLVHAFDEQHARAIGHASPFRAELPFGTPLT